MNISNFNKVINNNPSVWLKKAGRRRKWGWFNKLLLKPKVKFYIFKRKILNAENK